MASAQKDTIYIDVDDEITTIIEKLRGSKHRIVALVLPKRATVLQSIVNMKLLKRTADTAKKNLVLITSEASLLPLAGAVGVHVASSLQSKPAIPPAPDAEGNVHAEDDNADGEVDDDDDFDSDEAGEQPIGKLAGGHAANKFSEPETIQLDNDDDAVAAGGAAAAGSKLPKKGKNRKLKVPNFNKFRLILGLGILALFLLGAGFIWANTALPRALVILETDSTDIDTKADLTLDPNAKEFDPASNTLPAKIESKQQTGSQQVAASGQKNNGTKATGDVKFINCDGGEDLTIPAGTGISSGGNTFVTQETVSIPLESNTCKDTALTSDTVKVTAMNAGEKYNIAATDFAVSGYGSAVKASSSAAFSGGTDNIVKVVAQADIDSAKAKIVEQAKDQNAIRDELATKLSGAGFKAVTSSLQAGEPALTPSVAVGTQADSVTVSSVTTYTMYGFKMQDVKAIIKANVEDQIDTKKQKILKDGADKAQFQVVNPATTGPLDVTLTATSLAGPDIDIDSFTKQIAGKKTGDVQSIAKSTPGVTNAKVTYSPFWVHKVPKNVDKITIDIEKANGGSTSR